MCVELRMDPFRLLDLGDSHPDLFDAVIAKFVDVPAPAAAPVNDPAEIAAFFAR